MNNLVYLDEYVLAKKVTKEVPELLKLLDKSRQMLYVYRNYLDVAKIIYQIEESYMILELTHNVYKAKLEGRHE